MESRFLNVDLEIVSRSRLERLEQAVQDSAHAIYLGPLRRGVFLLSLECSSYPRNADVGIRRLCDAVEGLGPSERRLWKRALSRTFDVGYSLAEGDKAVQVSLQPATLSRVVAVGATVAFTCYRFPLPPVDPHP